MSSEWLSDAIGLSDGSIYGLIRLSIVLIVGWTAVRLVRERYPALSIVLARSVLTVLWVGAVVSLMGWTWRVQVLPASEQVVFPNPERAISDPIAKLPTEERAQPKLSEENGMLPVLVQSDGDLQLASERPSAVIGTNSQAFVTNSNAKEGVSTWDTSPVLMAVWLSVTSVLLVAFLVRAIRTWRCVRESTPLQNFSVGDRVHSSRRISGPCTAGWFSPVILLPEFG